MSFETISPFARRSAKSGLMLKVDRKGFTRISMGQDVCETMGWDGPQAVAVLLGRGDDEGKLRISTRDGTRKTRRHKNGRQLRVELRVPELAHRAGSQLARCRWCKVDDETLELIFPWVAKFEDDPRAVPDVASFKQAHKRVKAG